MGDDGGGSLISLDGVAPSRMVGVFASVIFPWTIKSRRSFLLVPAHPGSPREKGCKTDVCVDNRADIKTATLPALLKHL